MSEELRKRLKRIRKALEDPYTGGIWEGSKLIRQPFVTVREADLLALIDHLEADGMVLVPREPPEEMLQAGADNLFGSASEDWKDDARIIWSAMIDAALT